MTRLHRWRTPTEARPQGTQPGTATSEAPRAIVEPSQHLHGHLDSPAAGQVLQRGSNGVSGWVFHETRSVLGVVVTVNGRVLTGVRGQLERPDVAAAFPRHPQALNSGWAASIGTAQMTDEHVVVAAYVLLDGAGMAAVRAGRLGPMHRFAAIEVDLPSRVVWGGCFVEDLSVRDGFARVHGLAEAPGGVSHVEVFCNGHSAGLARMALPGRFDSSDQGPESAVALFERVVEVPSDIAEVAFTATAYPIKGAAFELRPWVAKVTPHARSPWNLGRLETVRSRAASRVDSLRMAASTAPRSDTNPVNGPRVLVTTHDLGLGGGQLYLHELVKRLHARGVAIALVSPRGGPLLTECEDLGIPVLVTGDVQPHDAEAYEAVVLQIASWAVEHSCDVALANTMSAFPGADAALRVGLPLVWAIHESFPLEQFWSEAFAPPLPAYVAARAQASLAGATRVVFEAEATRELYAPWTRPDAGVVVPYGVDLAAIDAYQREVDRASLRAELGFGESTLVLLCMGTIEPRKAQANLALAFAGSRALADVDVAFVMVGAQDGSPYVETVETIANAYGEQRIRIEPVQPDTYRWYHAADVLVCGSDVESLPRSMLEAMAFSRPVASTAVFGIPAIVREGITGFLCPARNQFELRRLLERVCSRTPAALALIGAAARALVQEEYDPRIYEQYYLDQLTALAEVGASP